MTWEFAPKPTAPTFHVDNYADYKPTNVPEAKDTATAIVEFMEAASQIGLEFNGMPIVDGTLHRTAVTGDKGRKRSGWYVAFDDDVFTAVYGNYKSGEQQTYTSRQSHEMSESQRIEHKRRMDEARAKREAEIKARQADAAKEAQSIWESADETDSHPYLTKKGIKATVRTYDQKIIIPATDENGDIATLQYISASGDKKFVYGGRKMGCYHLIGEPPKGTIFVCEGWATGMTIHAATGDAVAVAFDSGNLMPVTEALQSRYPNMSYVIAGDNDHEAKVNVGYNKASGVASALGIKAVFPDGEKGETDFNDMAQRVGLEEIRLVLKGQEAVYEDQQSKYNMPVHLLNPDGILSAVVNYYNATARTPQPGFAVQTALTLGSVAVARNFVTNKGNYSSMYFLNIARSATGKEHAKTVLDNIFYEYGDFNIMHGAGYTSAGAVMSALRDKPRHLTIIDEFGKYIEASGAKGNSQLNEANTQLMEAIGRCHGAMQSKGYSGMTAKKGSVETSVVVQNPAITLCGMTTPSSFYKCLSSDNIDDGFLGRFIIHESHQERIAGDEPDIVPVPQKILDWLAALETRYSKSLNEDSTIRPKSVLLTFENKCMPLIKDFAQECIQVMNEMDKFGLESIAGRTKEMAMRLSMVVELAKDPYATTITVDSIKWAIDYMRYSLTTTVKSLKKKIANSGFEADKKEILEAIRKNNDVPWSEMQKKAPYSKHKQRDLKDILQALLDADLVVCEEIKTKGRPKNVYRAIK